MASDAVHDINFLVSSEGRDFLIRNNGDQVKISSLMGKKVGLYFSASWCIPCRIFTPKLKRVYDELLASSKSDFEIIYISSDRNETSFTNYFSKMPWLSIPFADSDTKKSLKEQFKVKEIPYLVVLDGNGKVLIDDDQGVNLVRAYGVDAYPFTFEHIQLLKDKENDAKTNQTITSILVSNSCNYVISNDEIQIPVSELEGKVIGLYFSLNCHEHCEKFTPILIETYNKLKKEKGENFEIVLISLDDEDEDFKELFKPMPWLALPITKDEKCQQLKLYFEVGDIPALVIIGPDGKTTNPNAVELIKENGIDAYPFTLEKPDELDVEDANAKLESKTMKSPSVCGEKDFVIEKKDEEMVNVSCCCDKSKDDDEEDEEGKEG